VKTYTVKKSAAPVILNAGWESEQWKNAETADVCNGFDCNSDHIPLVQVKMLHDGDRICGLFRVEDRYVVAKAQKDQDMVCLDSCVEFFVQDPAAPYYYNFEMNCGGTILLYRCEGSGCKKHEVIPDEDMKTIERYHSLPKVITEEITEPTTWYLGFAIPAEFFVKYSGSKLPLSGQKWSANFTKCADKCSHPTWLSWMKLSRCAYHVPEEFGELVFE